MSTPRKHPRKNRQQLTPNKYLSETEVGMLQAVLRKCEKTHARDVIMLEVALASGARASEVLNITRADMNDVDQSVFIFGLKDSDNRSVPLPPELYKRLRALPLVEGKPFAISYQRMRQIWNDIRPVKKTIHSLRHTCALRLYQRTRDIKLVQHVLGHRSINNTMIYVNAPYQMDDLRSRMFGSTDPHPKGA